MDRSRSGARGLAASRRWHASAEGARWSAWPRVRRLLLLALLLALPGCEDVSVTAVDAALLTVSPSEGSLHPGDTLRLEVRMEDAEGNPLEGRQVSWSSDDESIAVVGSDGLVEARAPGTTEVRAFSGGAEGAATIFVTEAPRLVVNTDTLSFETTAGEGPGPSRTVSISDIGTGTVSGLTLEIVYSVGQPGGWLEAVLDRTSTPATATVRVSAQELEEGEYEAELRIDSDEVEKPATVRVTHRVEPPPARITPFSPLDFHWTEGEPRPSARTVEVTNSGGGTLGGLETSVHYSSGQPTGWLSVELSRSTAPATLTVSVHAGNLPPGEYEADIRVSSPDAENSPQTLTVRFKSRAAASTVRVSSLTFSTFGNGKHLRVDVMVVDQDGTPVERAWVGLTVRNVDLDRTWNRSGNTASDGSLFLLFFDHPKGCYVAVVTDVEADGLTWDGETPENEHCSP